LERKIICTMLDETPELHLRKQSTPYVCKEFFGHGSCIY
jgi:hypothetical protein